MAAAPRSAVAPAPATAFDRRLADILDQAAELFAEKGYERASLRELARRTGSSLAGLYHYFASKQELLFLLQKHTLESVLSGARAATAETGLAAVRAFIANHLRYFLAHRAAMTVLSHEDQVLTGEFGAGLAKLKHDYYELCLSLVRGLPRSQAAAPPIEPRTAVMSLFGMLNWIYTWHRPGRDPGAEALAVRMSALFLRGLLPAAVAI